MKIDAAILGNSMGIFRKLKIKLLCDLATSVQGDWSQDLEETFSPMLHYSVIHNSQSKPQCPESACERRKTVCIVYTVKYGFIFRKK